MSASIVEMPKEFLDTLAKLGNNIGGIAPKALEAAGKIVLEKVKGNLRKVLSSESTGELERLVGISPVKLDRNGMYNIKVGWTGNRKGNRHNAMIAGVLEYGRHPKAGVPAQPPRPFLKPAINGAKKPAQAAMQQIIEEEIEKL